MPFKELSPDARLDQEAQPKLIELPPEAKLDQPPSGAGAGILGQIWEGVKATPEAVAGMATGAAAWPLYKLGGVAKTITSGAEAGRETERQIAEYFTYMPQGKTAQESMEMVGKVIETGLWPVRKVAEVAEKMGLVNAEGRYFLETAGEVATFAAIPKIKAGVKAAIERPPATIPEAYAKAPPKVPEAVPKPPEVLKPPEIALPAEAIPEAGLKPAAKGFVEIPRETVIEPLPIQARPEILPAEAPRVVPPPVEPPLVRGGAKKEPGTLLSWIQSKGGIWDESLKGEIRAFNPDESGIVGLVRKGGKTADELAAQAVKEGWLGEGSGAREFLDLASKDIAASKQGKTRAAVIGEEKAPRGPELRPEEKEGFVEVKARDKVLAGNLKPKDEVLIRGEKYEHTGFDSKGRAIIKDGETFKLDPWEEVDASAIKRAPEREAPGPPAAALPLMAKEAPPEAVVSGTLPMPSKEAGFLAVPPLKGMARSIKEFFDPVASLPEKERFLGLRYKTLGNLDRVEGIVKRTWEKTKDLDPQVKADIFHYLDGQLDLSALPANVRPMANNLRTINNLIGEMLVKRGMLSRETFEVHKDAYIRYLYLKHVLGDESIPVGKTGKMDLTYLKQRKDLTPEQRRAIGLIEDVSVAEPYGLSKPLSDIAKYDFYEKIAENPEWVWQPSIVEAGDPKSYGSQRNARAQATIRNKAGDAVEPIELAQGGWGLQRKDGTLVRQKMGIGKLAEEVESQRKIAKQAPNVPEVQERLKTLEDALKKAQEETGKVTGDFVQLPTTPNYGPLAGSFVRKEIARDIQPVLSWGKTESSRALDLVVGGLEKGMAAFKVGKVALNIPTASRNIISNNLQLNMSGIPLWDIPGYLVKAAQSMKAKDATWGQARRNGLFKTNWAEGEIAEVLKTVKTMEGSSLPDIFGTLGRLAKYYGRIDDFFKLAKFIEQTEKGVSRAKAVIEAQKWGMDYSLADPFVKKARRFAVPFASYQYKIAPLIAESLAKRPWVIGKYLVLPYIMQEVARQTLDLTDQDWKKLKAQLPLFIKRESTMTILPWKSPEGNAQWVNLQYFFPWGNYQQFAEATGKMDIKQMWGQTGVGGPFLNIAHMLGTAKSDLPPNDPFTGQPVYNQLDSPTEKAVKTSEWFANQWIPPMLNLAFVEGEKPKGALGYTIGSIKGEKDIYGRKISPEQAALRWAGINIAAPAPLQAAKERQAKIMEFRASLARILKDPNISGSKKVEALTRFSMEIKKLGEVE